MFQKSFLSIALLITFGLAHQAQLMAAAEPLQKGSQDYKFRLESLGRSIQSVAYSPDGHHILATIQGDKFDRCCARMCSASNGKKETEIEVEHQWSDGYICHYCTELRVTPSATPGWASQGVFSPDGSRIAVGFKCGVVRLFNAANAKMLLNLFTGTNVRRITFNPQNPNHMLVALKPDTARIINSHTGRFLFDVQHRAYDASYSSSGKRIAIAGKHNLVHLCDGDSFACLAQYECRCRPTSVSFSNDEKFIAAGDSNGRVYIYDIAASKILHTWQATGWEVNSVAFSPHNHYLLIGGTAGGLATVWNTDRVEELLELKSGEKWTQAVDSAVFSPDATRIATGSRDGKALVWDVSKEKETFGF